MSKKETIQISDTEREHKFIEMDIDMSEETRLRLIEYGSRKFNELPDEIIENIMLEYGVTKILEDYIDTKEGEASSRRDRLPSPIIINSVKYKEEGNNLPSIELADLIASALSVFLKSPSASELSKRGFFNADDWAEEVRHSYLRMNMDQRVKYVQRWLDGMKEESIYEEK